jgi:GDP-L-fucose synthase
MQVDSKILVTGHNGLYGSAVVRALEKRGYTNILTEKREQLDLTRQQAVENYFSANRPEYVFHCAAKVAGIGAGTGATSSLFNLQMQTNVIDSAQRTGVKKFFFPGSNCCYPKFPQLPINEDQLWCGPLEPTSDGYSSAKLAGIKLLENMKTQYGFNSVILMPCNLYGINDNFSKENAHVMAAMISKIVEADINKTDVVFWGDGSAQREFLFADDAADAAVHCMENHVPDFMNLASGDEVTLKSLATTISKIVGYKGKIEWDTTKPVGTPRKGLDISKITATGWKPQVDLKTGIQRVIQHYIEDVR